MRRLSAAFVCIFALLLAACSAPAARVADPTVSPLTGAERNRLLQEQKDAAKDMLLTAFPSADVPVVDVVRFIHPSEWAPTLKQCMDDEGFPVSIRRDGGIDFPQVPGQEQATSVAYYTCSIMYPVDPDYSQPLNHGQLEYLYDYYTNDLEGCLSEQGYSPQDPPSFTTFEERFAEAPWSPYDHITAPSEEAWLNLIETCPQIPDGLYGNADK